MKKLAYLVIIVSLPVLLYFQYRSYTRFNPPEQFGFVASDSIDVNFYNPQLLKEYYKLRFEIPAFARQQWSENGVDVRYPNSSEEAQKATEYYTNLLATAHLIEDKLKQSFLLKQKGFNNADIKKMQEQGLTAESYKLYNWQDLVGAAKGDENSAVWELQKLLRKHDHDIPQDGIFDIETENALKALQKEHGHYPSGMVEKITLPILIKD